MAAKRAPKRDPEAGLAAVRALRGADEATLVDGLRRALLDPYGPVVAAAADLAAERELASLSPAILAAWDRLYTDAVTADPNCVGKTACATALDRLDHPNRLPFERGLTWVQMQPVWGGSVDVAYGLRARCVLAIARLGGPDALVAIARALADDLAPVRSAAAQALAYTGEPAAAALAMLVIRKGDAEPGVVADALGSLLALRPPDGLAEAERLLARGGEVTELATLALGQSRVAAALPLLEARLATAFRLADRQVIVTAIGLLRTDAARELLLARVRTAPLPDARQAITALGTHSQSDAMRAAVEQAAAGRGLEDVIEKTFG